MFESDKHFLSTGMGNVDDFKIMSAGNIAHFPKRATKSSYMECEPATISDTKFSVSGKVVISEKD